EVDEPVRDVGGTSPDRLDSEQQTCSPFAGEPAMKRLVSLLPLLGLVVFLLGAGRLSDDERSIADLIDDLKADKPQTRMLAARELANRGPKAKAALGALTKVLLEDKDAKVRSYAVYAIKQMGTEGKAAVPKLIEALQKDKDGEVRCIVADTLARL